MVPQNPSYALSSGYTARPIVEAYVDGLLVDVYADTGEPVPIPIKNKENKKSKKIYPKLYEQRVIYGRYLNTIFGKAECFVCERKDKLTIHHFVPTSKGGSKNYKENRLTTCRPCHDKIHAKPKRKRGSYSLKKGDNSKESDN
jgi:5-methylcytosine-specific restriction endonuclease McrA